MSDDSTTDALIAALRRELAGYLARGLPDRAAAVRVELARLGAAPETADMPEGPAEAAVPARPARPARPSRGRARQAGQGS